MSARYISPTEKRNNIRLDGIRTVKIAGKDINVNSHAAVAHRRAFCLAQPDIGEVHDHVIVARYNAIHGTVMTSPMVRRHRREKKIKSTFGHNVRRKPWVLNWRAKLLEQSWR